MFSIIPYLLYLLTFEFAQVEQPGWKPGVYHRTHPPSLYRRLCHGGSKKFEDMQGCFISVFSYVPMVDGSSYSKEMQGRCTHLAIEKRLWLHFPAGTRNDKPSSPGVKSRWLTCIQCCFATENVDTCSLNHPLLPKHSGCSSHLLSWLFQTVTYNGIWAWDHFNRTTCFCLLQCLCKMFLRACSAMASTNFGLQFWKRGTSVIDDFLGSFGSTWQIWHMTCPG